MTRGGSIDHDPFGVVGLVLAEKFRVERLVGEGGFGVVYAGTHLLLGEPIAIKFIKAEADTYLREARILFSLAHPGIVRMYDVGALDHNGMRLPWVVLELVNGPTLEHEISERRRSDRPFSYQELRTLFDPILDGIAFAHSRGIIHRDIKPSNISLPRSTNGAIEPKILDFGTARTQVSALESSLGKTGFTPLYGAPEQWDPAIAPPSPATDVYAVALTFLEAATLTEPHAGATDIPTIYRAVMSGTGRPRLDMVRPDLPPSLTQAVERALAVRPEQRFRDAEELRGAMTTTPATQLMRPLQPSAPPAPPPYYSLPSPHAVTARPTRPSFTPTIVAIAAATAAGAAMLAAGFFVTCNGIPGASKSDSGASTRPVLSPPQVTAADFDFGNAVSVAQKNQWSMAHCFSANAPFEGVVEIELDVRTTDGRVAGVRCSTTKTASDTGGPDASSFCACAQAEMAKWVFKPPRSDVGGFAGLVDETQTMTVRYTSKRP